MMFSRHRWLLPALAILLAASACTTVTNDLLQRVGTALLFLTDTDLGPQSVTDPDGTIQAVEWELTRADLDLGDGSPIADMLFGDTCTYTDTVFVSPTAEGSCSSGLVIGADDDTPVSVTLHLEFTMTVRRARPFEFQTADDDIDEVPNGEDICPLVPDPGQEDENSDGQGDACSVRDPVSGVLLPDTDGDGWPDFIDNCIWEPNPDQSDTMGGSVSGVPDGIGDACTEQTAAVSTPPEGIELGPIELTDLQFRVTYLTVDFLSQIAVLNCNWEAGSCDLDPEQIRFCANSSFANAVSGCP
jgi:hypothetical protein